MPKGQAWYVEGVTQTQMAARKWLSGPFDAMLPALNEAERLRPFYPGVYLSAKQRRFTGEPPVCVPRGAAWPSFDLKKRAEREAAAEALAELARSLGAVVDVENWEGDPDVTVRLPNLQAQIWLEYHAEAPMPIISWYGATRRLRAVPGAWADADVNAAHGHKATSLPTTWAGLFDALQNGILASLDGSAFIPGDA